MNYEIVELKEKLVVGLADRTNNSAADMGNVIGSLWKHFCFQGVYASVPHKVNCCSLGIYTDYDGTEKSDYTVLTACEVSSADGMPDNVIVRKIPAGNYAKFVVKGNIHTAITEFWQKLWSMDLPRSFVCDFEEYQNSDMEHAEIHVYIGLNK